MSRFNMQDRVTALAALVQALMAVQRLAETGTVHAQRIEPVIRSVYRLDIDKVAEAYGGVAALKPGLEMLDRQLLRDGRDATLMRLIMAVMAVERSYSASAEAWRALRDGLKHLPAPVAPLGQGTLAPLANLYATQISPLKPKVMVHGNPRYLSQDGVVLEVRALLLAALRSAVLWRQVGGSAFDFLLRRAAMRQAAATLLTQA